AGMAGLTPTTTPCVRGTGGTCGSFSCWSRKRRSWTFSSTGAPRQGSADHHVQMSDTNEHVDGRPSGGPTHSAEHEKSRLMVTQLLRSPVFNQAGEELGRLQELIVKLDGGGYPP